MLTPNFGQLQPFLKIPQPPKQASIKTIAAILNKLFIKPGSV